MLFSDLVEWTSIDRNPVTGRIKTGDTVTTYASWQAVEKLESGSEGTNIEPVKKIYFPPNMAVKVGDTVRLVRRAGRPPTSMRGEPVQVRAVKVASDQRRSHLELEI